MPRGPSLSKEERVRRKAVELERQEQLKRLEQITGKKWKKVTKNALEILKSAKEKPVIAGMTDSPKKKSVGIIDFDASKIFEAYGNKFLCSVKDAPYDDTECLVYCKIEACPFNQKGYFLTKNKK
jgi:hypothetical protein